MSDIIIVLGMHRSGTSAVAGVLTKLGATLPTRMIAADAGNPRGYFESVALMQLHDELLASGGSHWHDWRIFNPEWYRSPVAASYKRRAKELLESEFRGSVLPIVKDPRICRFVPFWLDVLRDIEATPRFVMPIRSPLDVAHSLKQLHRLPLTKGLLLWLRHVLDAEAQSRAEKRSIFTWDSFTSDWQRVCDKISADTGLCWPRRCDRASYEIDHFLAKELIHHETNHAELLAHSDVHEWTLQAYEALLELAQNPFSNSALDRLDKIRGLFEQSTQLFGRILVDYEVSLEDLQAQTHLLTSERDLLQVRANKIETESAAVTADLLARAEEAAHAHGESLHDKEVLSQRLAAITVELDDMRDAHQQITADLQARQQELAESNVALADLVMQLAQSDSALREVSRERDALSQTLAINVQELAESRASGESVRAEMSLALSEVSLAREQSHKALDIMRHEKMGLEAAHQHYAARLEEASKDRQKLAADLDQMSSDLRRIQQDANERALAQDAMHRQISGETKAIHEAQVHALRAKLIDAEAALSTLKTKNTRKGIWAKCLPAAVQRRLLARRLVRSGLFDAAWYRAEYPESVIDGLSAAEHYIETGFCRGFRPNPFFDTRWYLERYEDVRRSGVNPLLHYALHGYKEGRDPGPDFHTDFYLEANPDVRRDGQNPLAHYLRHGRHEGRLPGPRL